MAPPARWSSRGHEFLRAADPRSSSPRLSPLGGEVIKYHIGMRADFCKTAKRTNFGISNKINADGCLWAGPLRDGQGAITLTGLVQRPSLRGKLFSGWAD